MAFLEIKDLTFTYAGEEKFALRDVSCTIGEGELCLILSPNGGGKTTLLSLIHGDNPPRGERTGSIHSNGTATRSALLRQDPDLGLVADQVWREIAFAPENRGLSQDEIRLRVAEAAGLFGLERLFDRDVATLSGSEKIKTLLAAHLADRPDMLLLDEPAGGLDPVAERELTEVLDRLRREYGVTILVAEQYCEPFFAAADRILYLENGKLLFNGTPEDAARFLLTTGRKGFVPEPARLALSPEDTKTVPLTVQAGRAFLADTPHRFETLRRTERPGETLLSLTDVSFRFEKDAPDLVAGMDLSLCRGEILCLLGKGGAGKSTLLRLLAGDLKPLRGKRKVKKDVRIAYLPQDVRAIFEGETLREELTRVAGEEKADTALTEFGMLDLARRHPLDLSGGERQRAALAKISLIDPDAVLLDEPTRGLDRDSRQSLAQLLLSWKDAGKGILIVTHDALFAAGIASRCGLLWGGELASLRETERFFKETRLFTTRTARITGGGAIVPEEVKRL